MYHYETCGLDNVWLANGYTVKETPYGRAVAIHDADQLHSMLAGCVALKSGPLSRKEVKFLRLHLMLSQASLGELLGVEDQTVSLWERNGKRLPKAVDTLLRMLVLEKLKKRQSTSTVIDLASEQANPTEVILATENAGNWEPECADSGDMCEDELEVA